jgi:hypothetical protein
MKCTIYGNRVPSGMQVEKRWGITGIDELRQKKKQENKEVADTFFER